MADRENAPQGPTRQQERRARKWAAIAESHGDVTGDPRRAAETLGFSVRPKRDNGIRAQARSTR